MAKKRKRLTEDERRRKAYAAYDVLEDVRMIAAGTEAPMQRHTYWLTENGIYRDGVSLRPKD